MISCTYAEEWIERFTDEQMSLPKEVEDHLSECAHCREYRIGLEQIAHTLNALEIPLPSPQLVEEVMAYIRQRERQRRMSRFIPGLSLFRVTLKTLRSYLPTLTLPTILQREGWATAVATMVLVWGVLIAPQVEAGKAQELLNSPLVTEVNKIADSVRAKGEELADRISSLATGFIDGVTAETGKKTDSSELPENKTSY